MIDLELGPEHDALVETVREWGAKEVAPKIHDLDRAHRFEPDFLRQMAELQLLGICLPEEYGGAGMDYVSLGLACEELEYVDTHLRVIMSVHVGLNSMTLWCWGTEEQKKKYLVPQARGEKIATYGLTEPNAGSDAVGIQTTAVRQGDRYVLNGEKIWISLADVADHFLVIAWTDQEKKKKRDHSGMSAFIVERGFKGFSSYTLKEKWGILAGNTGGFSLQDVEVPVENRVGEEGEGFKVAMFALENGRYTVAAGATGLIRACRDASVALRPGPQDLRGADRRAPAGQGDDRADGLGLRGLAAPVAAGRLDEEHRPPQHPGDLARQVVRHRGQRARRRRRGADPRRQRLLRRVPGRPLLPQLQGRGDLRGQPRGPQADAGRLRPRLPPRQAAAGRAAPYRS